MAGSSGSSGSAGSGGEVSSSTGGMTGATSAGMQETGGTGYQQQGSRGQTAMYGQGSAPARSADERMSGYGQRAPSRHGASLAILAGALAFLEGLAFVIRSSYYHTVPGYAYAWTLHGWGWVLLVLGALLLAGGVSHLLGIKGSRNFTASMAILTAVVAFLTIFYSVIWGIVVVAASAFAAHALLSDRGMEERQRDEMGYGGGYGSEGQTYASAGQGPAGEEAMSQGKRSRRG